MEDERIDLREAIERLRVEACIRSLEGDDRGAALHDRAADVFEEIVSEE